MCDGDVDTKIIEKSPDFGKTRSPHAVTQTNFQV